MLLWVRFITLFFDKLDNWVFYHLFELWYGKASYSDNRKKKQTKKTKANISYVERKIAENKISKRRLYTSKNFCMVMSLICIYVSTENSG